MVVASHSGFAKRLASIRAAAGLSQYELAKRAELTGQAIAFLERGEREPSWPTVLKLARALGVSVADFDYQESDPLADQPLDAVSEAPAEPRPRPAGKRK